MSPNYVLADQVSKTDPDTIKKERNRADVIVNLQKDQMFSRGFEFARSRIRNFTK